MPSTSILTEHQQHFDRLFQRSRRRAYRLAYRLMGNATDAEDLTQDAYVRAWHCFGNYNTNSPFESWLFRIITNRAIDLQRRKKRVQMVPLESSLYDSEDGRLNAPEFAAPDSDPMQHVIDRTPDNRLVQALATLSKDYRTAILLHHVEQYSYQEIADTMQCPVGTVRSRIHRARQLLRHTLEN